MAISTKLMMRQGQALVMTPQLLQAIKLLQFSNLELSAFLQEELERNPLLEAYDAGAGPDEAGDPGAAASESGEGSESFDEAREGDWAQESLSVSTSDLAVDLGTDLGNAFEPEGPQVAPSGPTAAGEGMGLSATSWNGAAGGSGDGEAANLEAYVATQPSLREHLSEQLALACPDPRERLIGQSIIDGIDETGYLRENIDEIAERLDVSVAKVEALLSTVQSFDPSGVGARDLAECFSDSIART